MASVNVYSATSFTAFSGQVITATANQLSIRAIGGTLTQSYFGFGFVS